MAMKRTKTPWMKAEDFGRSLPRARELGHLVLAGSIDKPHGLRECHIAGPSGYIFVPSLAIGP